MEAGILNLSDRFETVGADIVHETIDGEAVIVNLKNGFYYSTDNVGRVIWGRITCGDAFGDILNALCASFPDHRDEIRTTTNRMIGELLSEGLIVLSQSAPDHAEGPDTAAEDDFNFAPPVLQKHKDMQDLLLVDPIHEVADSGWPNRKPDGGSEA